MLARFLAILLASRAETPGRLDCLFG